jgi:hypothetical protein
LISPGALIRDNYDRLGIVLWESPAPKAAWLKMQQDMRMRDVGTSRWWAVATLGGGGACVPELLMEYVRAATLEDALGVAKAHRMSYFTLVKVFPGLAEAMPAPEL